jgi:hypothetical protein
VADICKIFVFHAEILSQILFTVDLNLVVVTHYKILNAVWQYGLRLAVRSMFGSTVYVWQYGLCFAVRSMFGSTV